MKDVTLGDLQESVQDRFAFATLKDYFNICSAFLGFLEKTHPTRVISPSHPNYIFYQYGPEYGHRITRPLNADLLSESAPRFADEFERFIAFLDDLKRYRQAAASRRANKQYVESNQINGTIYTIQQTIGSIADSFDNPNQSRKRAGQLFEGLVKLVIQRIGLLCESRTISIPIPDYPGYEMSYELDLVFSRGKAIIASETKLLIPYVVFGCV